MACKFVVFEILIVLAYNTHLHYPCIWSLPYDYQLYDHLPIMCPHSIPLSKDKLMSRVVYGLKVCPPHCEGGWINK